MDLNRGSGTVNCSEFGTFNKSLSSTYHDNGTCFAITYADHTFADGNWGQDVLYLDGVDVSGVSFAVANDTDSTVGVLGIGLEGLETADSLTNSHPHTYANLPAILKIDGAIDTAAYSLYLDDADAPSGSVLFGGIDRSKYEGTLYTVPMVNIYKDDGKHPVEFDITLQGFGISSSLEKRTITTSQIPVLLDSGTTLTYFPVEYVSMIADAIGALDIGSGLYISDCPSPDDDREFVFDFGGFHIKAPLKSFLIDLEEEQGTCLLGIIGKDRLPAILGDLFLTHAYVVYNLDNYEMSLAQASYTAGGEEIAAIVSGVPGAIKAPGYSNTWTGNQAYTAGGNIFTLNDTASTPATIAV